MESWSLALCVTMVVCRCLGRVQAEREHNFIEDNLLISLSFPNDGPPSVLCVALSREPREVKVLDIDSLKEVGYQLQVDTTKRRTVCKVVPIQEEPQCLDLTCPYGWTLLHNTCFLTPSFVGSWNEAHSFCLQKGGALATVSSDTQHIALSRILSRDTWIGLKIKGSQGYSWADGSVYKYSRWVSGRPTANPDPNMNLCVEMREKRDFQWSGTECDQLKLCVCSVSATPLKDIKRNRPPSDAPSTAAPQLECPVSWIKHQSSCYRVVHEPRLYREAKAACQRMAANLATINTREENLFIGNHLRHQTWIGLTDIQEEGVFTWDDGSALTYTRWREDEPNNHGNEDCVVVITNSHDWNDISCALRRHFVCKRSLMQGSEVPAPVDEYRHFYYHEYQDYYPLSW